MNNQTTESRDKKSSSDFLKAAPKIELPKGGGAIRGMGEKFAANPVTGTGSMSIPVATSPGRNGFGPQLSLSYDSGSGNGAFGLGWNLSLPAITCKTDKGLPLYRFAEESDTFILSGAEDLVAEFEKDTNNNWVMQNGKHVIYDKPLTLNNIAYRVRRYRPRIEGLFARIERWTNAAGVSHWRTITKDNITTVYGFTDESRIADPTDATHIFSWLICESYDDKGNANRYEYKKENLQNISTVQIHEANRSDLGRRVNRYIKRIKYGNKTPRRADEDLSARQDWMFEVVFDYGEHYLERPDGSVQTVNCDDTFRAWDLRQDPFSSYRAGFEVRTYRLCQRVLMFHHFAELGIPDYLVRATHFSYNTRDIASFITAVTQSAYKHIAGQYQKQSLPPVEFEYSQAEIQEDILEVNASSLENLPQGLDNSRYQWVDLDGEGLSGILTEQGGAWFYKRNQSALPVKDSAGKETTVANFAPLERVATLPSSANLNGGQQLLDLAGDGQLDVVEFDSATPGFFERTTDDNWHAHRAFSSLPNISWRDPNLKFIDLTGDGHADILITEDEVFNWYASLAEAGFGEARKQRQVRDEEQGPRLVFADGTQSIYLADMSGDGLTDLVRIRNGEVCYWPNLGYARFGSKVSMDNAPWFDAPDMFDQARIRLADIDGSGVVDIIYLTAHGVHLYFNHSGNAWSARRTLSTFPAVDNLSAVSTLDLLGNGTACLVWSSPLPGEARIAMRYIDLMGGQKPHLLIKTRNNLGAETEVHYAASTKFYLQDKQAGNPWVTRLPFPVHCVEKVTVRDKWRGTQFSSSYSYHHGYFDGVEREFRGFARVEQVDVESYGQFTQGNSTSPYITDNHELYQPPIKTVTWYHTGAAFDRERILSALKQEYFTVAGFNEHVLPEPTLTPNNLTAEEWREAVRACKGMMLRQEVFELDVDALTRGEELPVRLYTTAYHNSDIQCLQPKAINRHAVFLLTESEAITYNYELDLRQTSITPDPRVAHTLNLRIDDHGNILESVAVVYPRFGNHVDDLLTDEQRTLINQVQKTERHLALNCNAFTQDINTDATYRLRMPCQSQAWEITGVQPAAQYFTLAELKAKNLVGAGATEIAYHQVANGTPQKRLVECVRSLYFADDLRSHRRFGEHGALGLPYESYKLALTRNLINSVYVDQQRITTAITALDAQRNNYPLSGYYKGDRLFSGFPITPEPLVDQYWLASGKAGFEPDAAAHFYLPESYTDSFGNPTRLVYDTNYDLFIQSSTDAMNNTSGIALDATTQQPRFDYRVLAPLEMVDANNNHTEVYFNILGMVVATAVKGKGAEADDLIGFDDALANPPAHEVQTFCTDHVMHEPTARRWLQHATARFVYHFGEARDNNGHVSGWADRPAGACSIVREQHFNTAGGNASALQVSLECADGSGNVLMKKVQAEPAPGQTTLRWIVNGLTVLNNKGKPVKQYEPAFSDSFGCESPQANGVTPVMYYDATGRVVRTELPDGTFSRVEFTPWHVKTFDANDTVKNSRWYAERLTATERGVPLHGATDSPQQRAESQASETLALVASAEEKRAARLAAYHADTPVQVHLDSLGREVIAIAHNRIPDANGDWQDAYYTTFTKLDAEGKPLWIRDARGNLVMQYITPPKPTRWVEAANETMPVGSVPCYDIAGNLLYQHSMDAGDRWMLMDAAGKPLLAWDLNETPQGNVTTREQRFYSTDYDALHRPVAQWLGINLVPRIMVEKFVYQDAQANDANNLNGQLIKHYDPSGLVQTIRRDFKGNVQEIQRTLNNVPEQSVVDWQTNPDSQLETDTNGNLVTYTQITEYDALNRMKTLGNWHLPGNTPAVYTPRYNKRGVLEGESLSIRGSVTRAIDNITYNAKGQKLTLTLGNGTTTSYTYDEKNFRLTTLRTVRAINPRGLQHLEYTYDPVGNITHILDAAQDTVFFNNTMIRPEHHYVYDAIYRLLEGTGRENANNNGAPSQFDSEQMTDFPVLASNALRNYTQYYSYDSVGNIMNMQHAANGAILWNRHYAYACDDTTQPASNRLLHTTQANITTHYGYDIHGNMLNTANVAPGQHLQWDHRDMIKNIDLIGGGTAYYQYDSGKQRTRKRIVNQNGLGGYWERIYLGGYERYRRYNGNGTSVLEEIETHHLFEGEQRLLMVDDVIKTDRTHSDGRRYQEVPIYRYQYSNHLGSACLELDHAAAIISYEEYHPYGTSAYRALKSDSEAPPKRYRYTGMERDEESGLSYHSARYYLPWLGRWVSGDPIGLGDGVNRYRYAKNNPIANKDTTGHQTVGTMTGIAASQRRQQAEKMSLISNIAHHPEQYPWASEKTLVALRAEVSALEKSAGSWEAKADIHTDFHKNVGFKVALGAGGLAVSGPVVGAAGLATAFGVGFAFSTARQGARVLDGKQTSISWMNSVEEGGWAGAFSAVSRVPGSKYAFAGLGVASSANEFSQDNKFTGTFDAATSIFALRQELFNFKINASIEPRLGAPATQSVATLGLSLAVTSGKGSPSSPFNVLMIGQVSNLISAWKSIADRTLKGDAGSIHGEDQWRGGQTIITAKLQLPNGGKVLVAAPNSSAGWRPGQRDAAIRLGYSPIDPYNPGSQIHAEGNLQSALSDRNSPYFGARVLGWAISRGRTGSSIICNEGCKNFTNIWGPQQK